MGVSNFVVEKSVNAHKKPIVADHMLKVYSWGNDMTNSKKFVKNENHSREYDLSLFFKYYT